MKIESSVTIDQPPSVVFEFMREEENMPLWVSNFKRLEQITEHEDEVGSQTRQIFDDNGREVEMVEEITAIVDDQLIEGILKHESFTVTFSYVLDEVREDTTRVNATIEYIPNSLRYKIYLAFNNSGIQKRHEKDLQRLKKAIEWTEDPFQDED